MAHDHQPRRSRCDHGRGRRPEVEHADLAEEAPRGERRPLATVNPDLSPTFEKDEEAVGRVTLLDESPAGLDFHLVGASDEEFQLGMAASSEEGNLAQRSDFGIAQRWSG